jgi:photosystem II stability/assembly factor-like uncharacterized protein
MKLLAMLVTVLIFACQSPVFAGIDQWTANGPFGGGVRALCRSPQFSTDQTIFAGTADGFFISTDRGASWTQSNSGLIDKRIISIAVSPEFVTDRTIFVSTQLGGFRSRDGGATWQMIADFSSPEAGSIAVSPLFATDRTVFFFLGISGGFKSTDGGDTWVNVSLPAVTILFSPDYANDHTLFAGAAPGGVYRSTDNGASWQPVNTGLNSGEYVHSLAISPVYASDRTLFAGTGNGIFVTTNGGEVWTAVSGMPAETVLSVSVSPNFAVDRTLVAGTFSSLYLSTDGGANWSIPAVALGSNLWAVLFSPDFASDHALFVGADAGFFTVVNTAGTWSASHSGLGGNYRIQIALSPAFATDQTLFAGAFSGGVHRSVDGGTSWQPKNNGLGNFEVNALQLSPLFPADHTLMAGTAGGVFISEDGGNSWRASNTGLTSLTVTALAVSPDFAIDRTVFAGTAAGVFKSIDGGGSWTPASSGLTDLNVLTMAISPAFASDRTLLVGTWGGGIAISVDAGDNWLSKNSGLEYSPHVNSLAFSPNYAIDRELFASSLTVYRSVDNGNSWSAANSGLTSTTISSIAVSPGYGVDHTLLVSTGSGNFSSTDSGAHWLPLGRGYDNVAFSPAYATDLTVFAGGGQVWKYTFSTKPNFISSVITYPANLSFFSAAGITVTGTASEGQGYGLQKVEVSTDGGATWQLASGTSNWSYFWSPAEGYFTIKVRATDNNGRVEPVATGGVSVMVDRTAPTGTIVYDYNNDVYKLNVNANDPGWMCDPYYPELPCGLMEMRLQGSSVWEPLDFMPILPYGTSSLWLRDRAGNTGYISQSTQYGLPVRLGDWFLYATIQEAFNSAASGNTIKLTARIFTESLTFGRGIALTLSGGFNNTFSSPIDFTTIIGAVTVQGDDLELQNINLNGTMTIASGSANLNNVVIQH